MSEREKVIERLHEAIYELPNDWDSHARLSRICLAVYPNPMLYWSVYACEALCDELIHLLEDADNQQTCHTVSMDCFGNPPYNKSGLNGNDVACGCSECGAPWSTTGVFRGNKLRHNFKACPICGRRIVE